MDPSERDKAPGATQMRSGHRSSGLKKQHVTLNIGQKKNALNRVGNCENEYELASSAVPNDMVTGNISHNREAEQVQKEMQEYLQYPLNVDDCLKRLTANAGGA